VLIGCHAACCGLDFDGCEDGNLLPHHVGRDGDGAQADEISRATGETELHGPAGAWVGQGAGVIAEEAQVRALAQC